VVPETVVLPLKAGSGADPEHARYWMPVSMITELTLLLASLTSWDERAGGLKVRRAWRGYDFEALDALQAAGHVTFSRRSKSFLLTEAGIRRAKHLEALLITKVLG
jgi:hypothetical protein